MSQTDESVLISGILAKDADTVNSFVQIYQDRVYAQALSILSNTQDAEEVAQDVFLKALRTIATFKGKSKLSTWLYSICYKTCLDALKKRKRRRDNTDIDDVATVDWNTLDDGLAQMEQTEQSEIIKHCLVELDETDAWLIECYYLQEMTTQEITDISGLKAGNIRIKLMRARKKLGLSLTQALPRETVKNYRHG